MDIQILEKQKMDIMKEMAATNVKISEAKNLIFKLQEEETAYLEGREKKALERINTILDKSKELLAQTSENYEEIHKLCQTVSGFCEFLNEAHGKFSTLLKDFSDKNTKWEEEFAKTQEKYIEIKKALAVERTNIDNEKKWIEKEKKKIGEEHTRISSQQHQIKVALELLKRKQ